MANVYCAYNEMVPIGELSPNPKNPNRHPQRQIEILAKIITESGWRAPITVSTRSGMIVRGHGRLMAAKHAGLDLCPVDYQDYESEEQELQDLLADNRIAELSENDAEAVESILAELHDLGADIELTGYEIEAYEDIYGDDEMQSIDFEDNGETESSMNRLKLNGRIWNISDDEAELLMEGFDRHIEETGVSYGYIRGLFND